MARDTPVKQKGKAHEVVRIVVWTALWGYVSLCLWDAVKNTLPYRIKQAEQKNERWGESQSFGIPRQSNEAEQLALAMKPVQEGQTVEIFTRTEHPRLTIRWRNFGAMSGGFLPKHARIRRKCRVEFPSSLHPEFLENAADKL